MKKRILTIWFIFLFQVDFGRTIKIIGVVTKGLYVRRYIEGLYFHRYMEYVKKYKVRYSNTTYDWMSIFNVSQCMSISVMKVKCERKCILNLV